MRMLTLYCWMLVDGTLFLEVINKNMMTDVRSITSLLLEDSCLVTYLFSQQLDQAFRHSLFSKVSSVFLQLSLNFWLVLFSMNAVEVT